MMTLWLKKREEKCVTATLQFKSQFQSSPSRPMLGGNSSGRSSAVTAVGAHSLGCLLPCAALLSPLLPDVVTDFDFSPFDQQLLATGSADEVVSAASIA